MFLPRSCSVYCAGSQRIIGKDWESNFPRWSDNRWWESTLFPIDKLFFSLSLSYFTYFHFHWILKAIFHGDQTTDGGRKDFLCTVTYRNIAHTLTLTFTGYESIFHGDQGTPFPIGIQWKSFCFTFTHFHQGDNWIGCQMVGHHWKYLHIADQLWSESNALICRCRPSHYFIDWLNPNNNLMMISMSAMLPSNNYLLALLSKYIDLVPRSHPSSRNSSNHSKWSLDRLISDIQFQTTNTNGI